MLHRIRNTFFVVIILIYILFEELIWKNTVSPIIRFISVFHLYRRFLEYIALQAGRITVLFLFIVPFVIGEAVGIFSGILAAQLHFIGAIMLYACKIPLVVIALAILQNGKEKLLTFGWFSVCYWWVVQKLEKLHNSQLYRQTNLWIKKLRKNFDNRSSRVSRLIGHLYYRLRNSI
jgi:hypothetical protein